MTVLYVAPLWPAGHRPRKGGDQPLRRPLSSFSAERRGSPMTRPISPPEAELAGTPDGGAVPRPSPHLAPHHTQSPANDWRNQSRRLISPHEGEMAGRPEGGAVPRPSPRTASRAAHPAAAHLAGHSRHG